MWRPHLTHTLLTYNSNLAPKCFSRTLKSTKIRGVPKSEFSRSQKWGGRRGRCRVAPDVGLAPSTAGGPAPSRSIAERAKGWGEEGGRGRGGKGGKGFDLREGPSNCNGGWGRPSKQQLGPDPHLGHPKGGEGKSDGRVNRA